MLVLSRKVGERIVAKISRAQLMRLLNTSTDEDIILHEICLVDSGRQTRIGLGGGNSEYITYIRKELTENE